MFYDLVIVFEEFLFYDGLLDHIFLQCEHLFELLRDFSLLLLDELLFLLFFLFGRHHHFVSLPDAWLTGEVHVFIILESSLYRVVIIISCVGIVHHLCERVHLGSCSASWHLPTLIEDWVVSLNLLLWLLLRLLLWLMLHRSVISSHIHAPAYCTLEGGWIMWWHLRFGLGLKRCCLLLLSKTKWSDKINQLLVVWILTFLRKKEVVPWWTVKILRIEVGWDWAYHAITDRYYEKPNA